MAVQSLLFEQDIRIELTYPVWKTGILTVVLILQFVPLERLELSRLSALDPKSNVYCQISPQGQFRAFCQSRTDDPEITNHVLWPTELKRQRFLWRRYCCKASANVQLFF